MANNIPDNGAGDPHETADSEEDSQPETHESLSPPSAAYAIPAAEATARQTDRDTPKAHSTKPLRPSPRVVELQRKITQLRSTIESTEIQLSEVLGRLSALPSFERQYSGASPSKNPSISATVMTEVPPDQQRTLIQAQKTLDHHIKQLGRYNQLKDIAMGMLGMIAEKEDKMLREVMEAREVRDDD